MRQVDIDEAKRRLSDLIVDVMSGETVYIMENGHRVQLVPAPVDVAQGPRQPGSAKGMIWMSDDFDDPIVIPSTA